MCATQQLTHTKRIGCRAGASQNHLEHCLRLVQIFKHGRGFVDVVKLVAASCEGINASIPLSKLPHRPDVTALQLTQPGAYYFSTTAPGLCDGGMLLTVNVSQGGPG